MTVNQTENVTIYTRDDLVKWAVNLPIEDLDDRHLKAGRKFDEAIRAELHLDGFVKVLKDRHARDWQIIRKAD
jgi:hypothetical protein